MLLYANFRRRKYGEQVEPRLGSEGGAPDEIVFREGSSAPASGSIEEILTNRFIENAKGMGSIAEAQHLEDEVDQTSEMGSEENVGFLTTKAEAREHLYALIESQAATELLTDYLRKILTVRDFLLTSILRKRFLRKRKAVPKLQCLFRMRLAKR